MQDKPTDDVAILSLLMVGVVVHRMNELGQLDERTARHLRHLVTSARAHSRLTAGDSFNALFDRLEEKLAPEVPAS